MFIMEMPWRELWEKHCSKLGPETLVAYLEGGLDADQGRDIKTHLDDCNACQSFAEDYRVFMADAPAESAAPLKKPQSG